MRANETLGDARSRVQGIDDAADRMPAPLSDSEIRPRFPRTTAVLQIAEMADRMRFAAASLEALAANAPSYEPATLRRYAATMARELVAEIGKRVAL